MKTEAFHWEEGYDLGRLVSRSTWEGLLLVAEEGGKWAVWGDVTDDAPLSSWQYQVKGKDIHDAKQRAQAAAMVVHSLGETSTTS